MDVSVHCASLRLTCDDSESFSDCSAKFSAIQPTGERRRLVQGAVLVVQVGGAMARAKCR